MRTIRLEYEALLNAVIDELQLDPSDPRFAAARDKLRALVAIGLERQQGYEHLCRAARGRVDGGLVVAKVDPEQIGIESIVPERI